MTDRAMFAGIAGLCRVAELHERLRWMRVGECDGDCGGDCGGVGLLDTCAQHFMPRPEAEARALLAIYARMNVELDRRFAARPGTVETLAVHTIDSRPCDPIEPDPNPVCVTEDDLT